jgi:hypothetical protein
MGHSVPFSAYAHLFVRHLAKSIYLPVNSILQEHDHDTRLFPPHVVKKFVIRISLC